MSADFETCPIGTMARLRRVEEAARKVVESYFAGSNLQLVTALEYLCSIYGPELEAERHVYEADRMRDVLEDR